MSTNCVFCKLDYSLPENTIIEETTSFRIIPGTGALVEGYLLIVSKRHLLAMSDLSPAEQREYRYLIKKYRAKFKSIYNQFPIIFEHGSPDSKSHISANSVNHAHTHIMNHQFTNESRILQKINLQPCNFLNLYVNARNYVFYLNPQNQTYISFDFPPTSQLMRRLIAEDLKIPSQYNWRQNNFDANILKTLQNFQ